MGLLNNNNGGGGGGMTMIIVLLLCCCCLMSSAGAVLAYMYNVFGIKDAINGLFGNTSTSSGCTDTSTEACCTAQYGTWANGACSFDSGSTSSSSTDPSQYTTKETCTAAKFKWKHSTCVAADSSSNDTNTSSLTGCAKFWSEYCPNGSSSSCPLTKPCNQESGDAQKKCIRVARCNMLRLGCTKDYTLRETKDGGKTYKCKPGYNDSGASVTSVLADAKKGSPSAANWQCFKNWGCANFVKTNLLK
jgi:hypothetical protein